MPTFSCRLFLIAFSLMPGGCATPQSMLHVQPTTVQAAPPDGVDAAYWQAMITAIDQAWSTAIGEGLKRSREPGPQVGGTVTIDLVLDPSGSIRIERVTGDVSKLETAVAVEAVAAGGRSPGGYGAWPDAMSNAFSGPVPITMAFHY